MRKPAELESVYVDSQLLEPKTEYSGNAYNSIAELENKKTSIHENLNFLSGIKVANHHKHLMVLGEAGAGKSTFLRMMGLEALKPERIKYQHQCIPVFVELKRLGYEELDIEKIIINEFSICGFPVSEDFTFEALKKGKLLILLDGLDEIPERIVNKYILKIKDFVNTYSSNRFIASCRTAARYSCLLGFTDFVMASFNDVKIETFINSWFQKEEDRQAGTAQRCWELLQESDNAAARELSQNPLLLTLLCLVYEGSQNFPKNRANLYEEALNVFLKDWLVQKRVERDLIYQDFIPSLEKMLLSEIAYEGFNQECIYFDKRNLVNQIQNFFSSNLNTPEKLKKLDGEKVLRTVEVQQGILVESAKNVYRFSHLTFQEYLTAYYINSCHLIEKLVTAHLNDTRWQEVFLLVAGLMSPRADELLLLMEKQAQKLINTPKLEKLLHWVSISTREWQGDFNPVAVRALTLDVVGAFAESRINDFHVPQMASLERLRIDAFGWAYALASNLDKRIIPVLEYIHRIVSAAASLSALRNSRKRISTLNKILRKLKVFQQFNFACLNSNLETLKIQAPNNGVPDSARREFAKKIWETWLRAFNLPPELILLSEQEVENLSYYLYANLLIIKCKEAAMSVSPDTWVEVESRMLKVWNL